MLLLWTALVVFVLVALERIGYAAVSSQLYALGRALVRADSAAEITQTKRDILALKKELTATSAQDEFARWAKLRRQLDKKVGHFEKTVSSENLRKAAFEYPFTLALRVASYAAYVYLVWSLRDEPMFFLPKAWSGPFAPFLEFPAAPLGSVSVLAWMFVCRRVFEQVY